MSEQLQKALRTADVGDVEVQTLPDGACLVLLRAPGLDPVAYRERQAHADAARVHAALAGLAVPAGPHESVGRGDHVLLQVPVRVLPTALEDVPLDPTLYERRPELAKSKLITVTRIPRRPAPGDADG